MKGWLVSLWFVVGSWSANGQSMPRDRLANAPLDSATTYRQMGQLFWQSKNHEQALIAFAKCVALRPSENGIIGYVFLTQFGEYARAIRYFDDYDALTANFEDVYANNPISYLRGLAYQKMGDHDQAIEQMSCGIAPIALKHGVQWVNYRYFINRAVSYLATQQPERALADLDNAIKNFDRSALAQYYRGQALLALNRRAEAKLAFQDASFFLKALRVERKTEQEDDFNPVCDEQIDAALAELK